MSKSNSDVSENSRFFGSITASAPFKNLLAKSKQKAMPSRRSKIRLDIENMAPVHHNVQIRDPPLSASTSFLKKSPIQQQTKLLKGVSAPPVLQKQLAETPEPPVKVVVRIKPGNGYSVRKVADGTVSVGERKYKFDSVFDSNSKQGEIYELIGAPVVRDALSGYNTSIVAYGQTGSGKTYTMWGPPSAMVEDPSVSGNQGIVPRIFENLFSQIQKEQESSDGKQRNYQCRCSFLEVYDEKIGDLLDPTHRDIEIRDDAKNGFYVDSLAEEYVSSYEDVTQILIKGLANRKIGATSINSKSSRSHIMLTCIIESWCKDSSSKCFGSSRTSRISLVDLAGFERNVGDDTTKQHVKEGKYIKKSTSQLGHLVNILADGNPEEVPYRNSRLTHLLRESFGGNSKLSIICTVSTDSKHTGETLSTLRLGLRAKLMKNEPVVNEITEDDVNDLSDQIRQLKEELMRAKSNECTNSLSDNHGYFGRGNVRESLNQLRLSLNRSLILPRIDNDSDEELHINEDDVMDLKSQIDNIHKENLKADSENGENTVLYSAEGCETDLTCEHYLSCSEESENEEISSSKSDTVLESEKAPENSIAALRKSLSIEECHQSAILQGPVLSESPKIKNSQRKSLIFASNHLANLDEAVETSKNMDSLRLSHQSDNIRSSLRSSRIFPGPTESLAASLHRGLQIIDYHQKNSASTRSSVSFSFEHLALKPCLSADKANASVQTSQDNKTLDPESGSFVCTKCLGREIVGSDEVGDSLKTWIVPANCSANETKDLEKDLALAIEKEQELTSICNKQAAEIEQLNQQLEKYKCATVDEKSQMETIKSDDHENKLLTWNTDQNAEPEFIKEKCEIKEVPEEDPNHVTQKSFSLEEKESLLQEIEILKNKLKSYTDTPVRRSCDNLRSSLLSQSFQLRKSTLFAQANSREEFEKEREKWMEMESEWISLTDELRIDIESNRQRAEQAEMELRLEKKCTEELDDVLKRSVLGHARMVEHYAELQDKYNEMVVKHRAMMEGIAEVKRAASKAGAKGRHGSRFAKALATELSALRVERERERELLRKENRSLKIQLKDTAEAVHAAGEVLVRLKEAEEAASMAENKSTAMQEENDKLRKQVEKLKRKHKMEMVTMKQYLAESRLPEAALRPPLYREDSDVSAHNHHDNSDAFHDDDQAWRAEFGAIYQEQY